MQEFDAQKLPQQEPFLAVLCPCEGGGDFHKSQSSKVPLCEVEALCSVSLWLFFISDDLFWPLNYNLAVVCCSSLLRQVLSTLSHPSESQTCLQAAHLLL